VGDWGFGLGGGGDAVRLFDPSGALVDVVVYDDEAPWPTEPDGNGPTLELLDPALDNALAASWSASAEAGGTPGAANSVTVSSEETAPRAFHLASPYPNPFREATTVEFELAEPGRVTLRVYDALGREVARLVDGEREAGPHEATFRPQGLASGLYLVRLETALGVRTRRVALIR
jgi:hypothetical protein